MEENIDLSPLEYARVHHLAIDHQSDRLPLLHIEGLNEDDQSSQIEDNLSAILDFHIEVNTAEYLEVDKNGFILLQDAQSQVPIDINARINSFLDQRMAKKLHVELPLLKTDHDTDTRAFATWEQLHFRDGSLPHEPLENELDQGLEWPTRCKRSSQIIEELKTEKLYLQKEVLLYLQMSVVDQWTQKDAFLADANLAYHRRNAALEPVTPPLLPSLPFEEPYIPSSPACHLPVLSDPPSLINDDLEAVEKPIFEYEKLVPPETYQNLDLISSETMSDEQYLRSSDAFSEFLELDSDELPSNPPRLKIEDLKVEVPLAPYHPTLLESPMKSVKFNEFVEEIMLLDSYTPSPPLQNDGILPDAMIAAASIVKRHSEQEQLQEADSKCRVRIAKMDFSRPDPPWKYIQDKINDSQAVLAAQMELILSVKQEFDFPTPLPGARMMNQTLFWAPFPSELGLVHQKEKFGEEHDLDAYLLDAEPITNSGSLTWKPHGFRVLTITDDDGDGDDELEFGHFAANYPKNVSILIRKRKKQYDEVRLSIANTLKASKVNGKVHSSNMTMEKQSSKTPLLIPDQDCGIPETEDFRDPLKQPSSFLIAGGVFSAGSALDNFLEIRASKKQKPIDSSYFAEQQNLGCEHGPKLSSKVDEGRNFPVQSTEPLESAHNVLIEPILNKVLGKLQCIISSTNFKRRTLMRTLQSLLPTLSIIERNFSAHNTTAWLHGSVTRSPIRSPLADEADLIISPSTAIILTTIAQIRQKPLPGQKTKVAIQERIEKVSIRYERLLVLVSEGDSSTIEGSNGVNEQSSAAIAELTGFCAALETLTLTYYVTGGEVNLAKWIASIVSQVPTLDESMTALLLAEETLWELFLRRVGMNAFAAQMVLVDLKAPDKVDGLLPTDAGMFGLTAFMEMGLEQRAHRFARLLGGAKVLQGVGRAVDMIWAD